MQIHIRSPTRNTAHITDESNKYNQKRFFVKCAYTIMKWRRYEKAGDRRDRRVGMDVRNRVRDERKYSENKFSYISNVFTTWSECVCQSPGPNNTRTNYIGKFVRNRSFRNPSRRTIKTISHPTYPSPIHDRIPKFNSPSPRSRKSRNNLYIENTLAVMHRNLMNNYKIKKKLNIYMKRCCEAHNSIVLDKLTMHKRETGINWFVHKL